MSPTRVHHEAPQHGAGVEVHEVKGAAFFSPMGEMAVEGQFSGAPAIGDLFTPLTPDQVKPGEIFRGVVQTAIDQASAS